MGLKDRGYSGDASMEDAKGAINRSRRAGALTSNAHADSNGSSITNGNGGVTNGNGILNGYDEHDSINFEADTSIYNAALDAEHVLDSMLDAFIEVDSDGVILLWNGKAEEMFGWSRSEVVGCYVQDMIVPERYRELYNNQVLVEAIKMAYKGTGEVAERNIILKKRDGTEIPVLSRAYAYKDGNTIRIGGSVRDTSTLRTMEERLASAYLRDQLTGLPNRAYLTYQVNYLLARDSDDLHGKAEVAIAAVDIDRFTAINDAYGQEVGDEVLIEVSSRLSSIAGDGALLGRFGADEFFVCFDGDGATERAEEFARRSLESFKDPVSTSKGYLYIDVSVGVGSSGSGNLFGNTQDFDRSLDLLEQGKNHLDHAVSVTGDAAV
ncbi:MAG: diguanylate cyclase, partial [Actinobacteria bacterium]|nr:diguanylate cyclase [Actinomycetota bacterium]